MALIVKKPEKKSEKKGILPKITPKPGMIIWEPGRGSYKVPYPKPSTEVITITPQKGGPGGEPEYEKTRVFVGEEMKKASPEVKEVAIDVLKKGGIPSEIKGKELFYYSHIPSEAEVRKAQIEEQLQMSFGTLEQAETELKRQMKVAPLRETLGFGTPEMREQARAYGRMTKLGLYPEGYVGKIKTPFGEIYGTIERGVIHSLPEPKSPEPISGRPPVITTTPIERPPPILEGIEQPPPSREILHEILEKPAIEREEKRVEKRMESTYERFFREPWKPETIAMRAATKITPTDPFGFTTIGTYIEGKLTGKSDVEIGKEIKEIEKESLRFWAKETGYLDKKIKPYHEVLLGAFPKTATGQFVIAIGAGYGVGGAVRQVGTLLPTTITSKLIPVTGFMMAHPKLIAGVGYGAAAVPEVFKAKQMFEEGMRIPRISAEVGKDIINIIGFGEGFKYGLEKGYPVKYEKVEAPKKISKTKFKELWKKQTKERTGSVSDWSGKTEKLEFHHTSYRENVGYTLTKGEHQKWHTLANKIKKGIKLKGEDLIFYNKYKIVDKMTHENMLIGYQRIEPLPAKTLYKGVYLEKGAEAYPLIGRTEEGWVMGTPEVNLKDFGSALGWKPITPLETKIVKKGLKTIVTPTEEAKITGMLDEAIFGHKLRPKVTRRLLEAEAFKSPKEARVVYEQWAKDWAKHIEQSYGSATAFAQMPPEALKVRGVPIHDYDVMAKAQQELAEEMTKDLLKRLKGIKETVWISERIPTLIETPKGHAIDLHHIDEILGESLSSMLRGEGSWGVIYKRPPVKLPKLKGKAMALDEFVVRKGLDSVLTLRTLSEADVKKYTEAGLKGLGVGDVRALPEAHRLKDIKDFFIARKEIGGETASLIGLAEAWGITTKELKVGTLSGYLPYIPSPKPSPVPSLFTGLVSLPTFTGLGVSMPSPKPSKPSKVSLPIISLISSIPIKTSVPSKPSKPSKVVSIMSSPPSSVSLSSMSLPSYPSKPSRPSRPSKISKSSKPSYPSSVSLPSLSSLPSYPSYPPPSKPSYPSGYPSWPSYPPPSPPPKKPPELPGFELGIKRRKIKRKPKKPRKKYVPSLIGLDVPYYGEKPRILMGIGIRPILGKPKKVKKVKTKRKKKEKRRKQSGIWGMTKVKLKGI